ncbi:vitamin K epoxide reductase complex subunit 1-like protein 1 [Babylonia areolata]|uniref:vitamin K epoxide reductase complex subunit 1-like protein 1 n=1 Tax=Babylonia areolata TaxID=304850 RepID=UPI003FD2E467
MAMPDKAKHAKKNGTWIRTTTLILCALGMIMSAYSIYVEVLVERLPGYKALCDISPTMSCSRVFSSRWGKGMGLVEKVLSKDSVFNQPNGVYGMAVYTFLVIMAFQPEFPASLIQAVVSFMTNLGSVYLAYILFFVLRDVCVICISTYVINFLIFLASLVKLRRSYCAEQKKLK